MLLSAVLNSFIGLKADSRTWLFLPPMCRGTAFQLPRCSEDNLVFYRTAFSPTPQTIVMIHKNKNTSLSLEEFN